MKRWIGLSTGIVVLCTLAWVLYGHPFGSLGVRLNDGPGRDFAIRFKKARLFGWSGGKRVWALEAGDISIGRDRRIATFSGTARGTLLMDGKPAANIYARKVFYNMFTGNVLVPEGARLSVKKGPTLKVKSVLWDGEKSVLFCKQGVSGSLAGGKFKADRVEADIANKEVRASKVAGSITLPGDVAAGLVTMPGGVR
jgi:hypothetical protein